MNQKVRDVYANRRNKDASFVDPDAQAEIDEYNRQINVIQKAVDKIAKNIPKSMPIKQTILKIKPNDVEQVAWPITKVGSNCVFLTEDWNFVYDKLVLIEDEKGDKRKEQQYFPLSLRLVRKSFSEIVGNQTKPINERFMKDAALELARSFCSDEMTRLFNIKPDPGWVPYIENRPSVCAAIEENNSERHKQSAANAKSISFGMSKLIIGGSLILAIFCSIMYSLNFI